MVDGKVFAKDKSKAEKLDSGWAVLMVVLLEVLVVVWMAS